MTKSAKKSGDSKIGVRGKSILPKTGPDTSQAVPIHTVRCCDYGTNDEGLVQTHGGQLREAWPLSNRSCQRSAHPMLPLPRHHD